MDNYELPRRFYDDDIHVAAATMAAMGMGANIFQVHMLDDSEEGHVRKLLEFFDPPFQAHVLDCGCGVGSVSLLMSEVRPDLSFTLVNRSAAQLALCPHRFNLMHGDFQVIKSEIQYDAAMFLYSLGHGKLPAVMSEMARALKPGGVLFIYDLVGDNGALTDLEYVTYGMAAIAFEAAKAGFRAHRSALPATSTARYEKLMGGLGPFTNTSAIMMLLTLKEEHDNAI